ncbi:COP9 signalosome complex subunit 7-like isoform X7 [Magnolia sinica]|uniref:COP9 signalosome complex subunit 7-like isoform X7 n=1 Tax=Magnolia sinica TaxID=86752 RepID=UPI00265A440A|nr:COP9 signalosome complex subunit 7-like isoform X7 [Magnolia sinica]
MDIEQKQADLIEHFVKQVKSPSGAPVSKAIVDATSHPLLFTFSEILSLTNVAEGIVRGKLNQLRRCFEVQCAAGRDLRPGQLGSMIEILSAWLTTSDNLLVSIQDKIKWADTMGEAYKKHKKEIEDKVEEKKSLKADMGLLGHEEIHPDSLSLMELRTMKKIKTNPSGGVLCNLNDEARGMEQFGGLPVDMLDFCSRYSTIMQFMPSDCIDFLPVLCQQSSSNVALCCEL